MRSQVQCIRCRLYLMMYCSQLDESCTTPYIAIEAPRPSNVARERG